MKYNNKGTGMDIWLHTIGILGENKFADSKTAAINMNILTKTTKNKTFEMRYYDKGL